MEGRCRVAKKLDAGRGSEDHADYVAADWGVRLAFADVLAGYALEGSAFVFVDGAVGGAEGVGLAGFTSTMTRSPPSQAMMSASASPAERR